MLKIKYLILLSSTLLFLSCGMKIKENIQYDGNKYSLRYLSGGQEAFNYTNTLKQQLIVNDLYRNFSNNEILVSLAQDREYLSTSITKVASRESNTLSINIKVYDGNKADCVLFDKNYVSEQSFLVSESSATLGNRAAQDDIYLINSENISYRVVDDLLFQANKKCIVYE